MIHEFLETFSLFANSYFSGWLIAVTLAMIGVIVVARDQIFIGAAVAQASTLGIALAMLFSGVILGALPSIKYMHDGQPAAWPDEDAIAAFSAVLFAVVASVLTARKEPGARQSHESVTGWIFLASAALSVLLVTKSPHGLEEVHRLLSSSIIGATGGDVALFAALAAVTAAVLILMHRRILMIVMDETTAAAIGINVTLWGYAMAGYLGLVLGLALRSSGLIYAFGCLILPGIIARNLCRQVRPMFLVAPAAALMIAIAAFIVANHYDWPPAQATVALLAVAVIPASLFRRLRPR